jgi:putative two-component system response regulator
LISERTSPYVRQSIRIFCGGYQLRSLKGLQKGLHKTRNYDRKILDLLYKKEAETLMKLKGSKILIVDDEPHVCELLVRWLTPEGYNCVTAFEAGRAMHLLQEEKFDLVLADIMLPGISGIDLLVFIKGQFPDVAVLIATAVDDRRAAVMTLELGACAYVIKPFELNEILIHVATALERRRIELQTIENMKKMEVRLDQKDKMFRAVEKELVDRLVLLSHAGTAETREHELRVGLYSAAIA